MFDGVHAGHQALIKRARELAGTDCRVAAHTFLNHPAGLFRDGVTCLSANGQREALLMRYGADEVIFSAFTKETAAMSPEEFVLSLLKERRIVSFVCGFNHTFGRNGAGTGETLRELGIKYGFGTEIVPPVMLGGEPVSSSSIRECLRRGNLETAERMLTRPYALYGTVTEGNKIGRGLGYPTANLATGNMLLPPDGVYVSRTKTAAGVFGGVTNIGMNPTVHGKARTVETHLFGFSGDLYGMTAEVSLLGFLRPETAFESAAALQKQIARDADEAKFILCRREAEGKNKK